MESTKFLETENGDDQRRTSGCLGCFLLNPFRETKKGKTCSANVVSKYALPTWSSGSVSLGSCWRKESEPKPFNSFIRVPIQS